MNVSCMNQVSSSLRGGHLASQRRRTATIRCAAMSPSRSPGPDPRPALHWLDGRRRGGGGGGGGGLHYSLSATFIPEYATNVDKCTGVAVYVSVCMFENEVCFMCVCVCVSIELRKGEFGGCGGCGGCNISQGCEMILFFCHARLTSGRS